MIFASVVIVGLWALVERLIQRGPSGPYVSRATILSLRK